MKEACPICKKDNYMMPGLPSHLKRIRMMREIIFSGKKSKNETEPCSSSDIGIRGMKDSSQIS
jgi:molybdopterin-biosynthesis enzyme MoeA-like protein